jgi:uncharacterized protein (DUF1330 family)
MSCYVIADVTVTDADKMAQYRVWSSKAMAEFGAKILVRGGEFEVLEGPWTPSRLVVLEFPDRATAKAFYASQTYSHARSLREGAGVMRMIVVDGVPAA